MAHRVPAPQAPEDRDVGRRITDLVHLRRPGRWGALAVAATAGFLLGLNLEAGDPFTFAMVVGACLSWLIAGLLLWAAIVRMAAHAALKVLLGLAFWLLWAGGIVLVVVALMVMASDLGCVKGGPCG